MHKTGWLVSIAAAGGLLGALALAQPPPGFATMEKMKMSWDLGYKLKTGEVTKYEIDTISSQTVSSYNVAEAGSESTEKSSNTSRVYFTQRVASVDGQGVPTLEFLYDNAVLKAAYEGQEQVMDASALIGRKFTVRVTPKGKVIDVEGSGDVSGFQDTMDALFVNYPDKTLRIGDEWEDRRETQGTDPTSGLQIAQTTAYRYRVEDFEEFQRRDTVVLTVFTTIDQQLGVMVDTPGDVVVRTEGRGDGSGSGKGRIRVDARTGELVTSEQQLQIRNSLTVDEHQLVGATIRTKYTTEVSITTTAMLQ
jgi:hypothetical protein